MPFVEGMYRESQADDLDYALQRLHAQLGIRLTVRRGSRMNELTGKEIGGIGWLDNDQFKRLRDELNISRYRDAGPCRMFIDDLRMRDGILLATVRDAGRLALDRAMFFAAVYKVLDVQPAQVRPFDFCPRLAEDPAGRDDSDPTIQNALRYLDEHMSMTVSLSSLRLLVSGLDYDASRQETLAP